MNRSIGLLYNRVIRLIARRPVTDEAEIRDRWRSARSCAVLCGAGLGDALMAVPLLRAIADSRPDLRIVAIVNGPAGSVIGRCGVPVEVVRFDRGGRRGGGKRFRRELRRKEIDIFLGALPSNTVTHSRVAFRSGARVVLKHAYDYGYRDDRDFSFLYSRLLDLDRSRHRVEHNLDLVRSVGEDPAGPVTMRFDPDPAAADHVDRWLAARGMESGSIVAIHPGGGRSDKYWPAERFAAVAAGLADAGRSVVVVGGPEEQGLGEEVCRRAARGSVVNAAGEFDLDGTAALLRGATLLVSNDSGIMHLAVAVGTPTVALFGPTDPRHIGPWSNRSISLVAGAGGLDSLEVRAVREIVERALVSLPMLPPSGEPGPIVYRHAL